MPGRLPGKEDSPGDSKDAGVETHPVREGCYERSGCRSQSRHGSGSRFAGTATSRSLRLWAPWKAEVDLPGRWRSRPLAQRGGHSGVKKATVFVSPKWLVGACGQLGGTLGVR